MFHFGKTTFDIWSSSRKLIFLMALHDTAVSILSNKHVGKKDYLLTKRNYICFIYIKTPFTDTPVKWTYITKKESKFQSSDCPLNFNFFTYYLDTSLKTKCLKREVPLRNPS
jgi:hypothetical protein